jgi:hypothetical protein
MKRYRKLYIDHELRRYFPDLRERLRIRAKQLEALGWGWYDTSILGLKEEPLIAVDTRYCIAGRIGKRKPNLSELDGDFG